MTKARAQRRGTRKKTSAPEKVLVLRTCNAHMTSFGGFKWPESGDVEAPDWDPAPECGRGLHGLLGGVGNYRLLSSAPDAKWLLVEVPAAEVVAIDKEKVKFRRGTVVYCGNMAGAFARISRVWADLARTTAQGRYAAKDEHHAASQGNSGHAASQGNYGHAASQGNSGHAASQGYSGHAASQGDSGHAASQGDSGHAASQGDYGHAASQGNSGHAASQGNYGHAASQGNYGHAASQGYSGHAASQGYSGHAAAMGKHGSAVVQGLAGRAKAGPTGAIVLAWWDKAADRRRFVVGYVGENGIEADVWYCVDAAGNLVRA